MVLFTVAALVVLQLIAIVVYKVMHRDDEPSTKFASQGIDGTVPPITAKRADTAITFSWPVRPARLIYFWSTTCEECVEELPKLLAFGRSAQGRVEIIVIVDDDWKTISAFFHDKIPPEVVIETGKLRETLGVFSLPDSFLVDPKGQLIERYRGPRDWSSTAAREHFLGTGR